MPELRRDPLTGHWVIIAQGREQRPQDFHVEQHVRSPERCAFCAGHESETPDEVAAIRPDSATRSSSEWQVRVVPNKYPALLATANVQVADESAACGTGSDEMFQGQAAFGVHEVIIESPAHLVRSTDMDKQRLADVVKVYRDRLRSLRDDVRVRFGIIFKNVGPQAGATIEHTHSQLVGLPIVPPLAATELAATSDHYERHGNCLFCDLIHAELVSKRRVVATTDHYVAICPYAARKPYETWILPRLHSADFDSIDDTESGELAEMLLNVLHAIDAALDRPAYNYIIQTAPFDTTRAPHYHWRIAIIPRLTIMAGFEWGTGCFINPVSPENAAQELRIFEKRAELS